MVLRGTQSYTETVKWYRQAANKGNEDVINKLKELENSYLRYIQKLHNT